jgi:hypothetical protein
MHSYMLGNVIANQLIVARNWPFASAITMILTTLSTVGVIVMLVVQKKEAARLVTDHAALSDRGELSRRPASVGASI